MKEAMGLLGLRVRDAVSGFEGVVVSISFDLYGCIQAIVRPPVDEKGKGEEAQWFDVKRLTVRNRTPVMAVPTFADAIGPERGPAEKPYRRGL